MLVQLRGVGTTNITEIADGPVAIHVGGVYTRDLRAQRRYCTTLITLRCCAARRARSLGAILPPAVLIFTSMNHNWPSIWVISTPLMAISIIKLCVAPSIYPSATLSVCGVAGASNKHDAYTELLDNYVGLGPQYPAAEAELGDFDQSLDLGQKGPETAGSVRMANFWSVAAYTRIRCID